MASSYCLGVDVGGTFTDLVALDEKSGALYHSKVHSTPHDQSLGVRAGIDDILSKLPDSKPVVFRTINHGTTIATNTILEQRGAKVALIVTEGYHDILQSRRSHVPGGLAGWITWKMPDPLAPLELTIEAPGRIAVDGEEVREFNAQLFEERLETLAAEKPDAFTVSLINSFANDKHERRILDAIRKHFPKTPISLSCDVQPELVEYERTITTVANAYLQPSVTGYLEKLWENVREQTSHLNVLRSDGGLSSVSLASQLPITLALSGPAGGVAGIAQTIAANADYQNLITFDMGGTSTDVALIENGAPRVRRTTTVGDLAVRVPSIDVHTVGAGGGSIAHVPELTKALRVGPQSAGADPGPACYGKGGTQATVTDANIVLGYLPEQILGDEVKLDVEAAKRAVQDVADGLSISLLEAAEGILRIANETIYGALRVVTVEQGLDPKDFRLVAFGGAGPMHANSIGVLLNNFPVIVPPSPGVLCAKGDILTALRLEVSKTFLYVLAATPVEDILQAFEMLKAEASDKMSSEQGVAKAEQQYIYQMDVRYSGQAINISIDLDMTLLIRDKANHIVQTFETAHEKMYGFQVPASLELINLRIVVQEITKMFPLPLLETAKDPQPPDTAMSGDITMIHQQREYRECRMWDRSQLLAGHVIHGPCLVTEIDSTTTILPDFTAEIDKYGNILIRRADQKATSDTQGRVGDRIGSDGGGDSLDPITVDIFESGLKNARFEMDALVTRAAMSPAIREQQDEYPMIAEPGGLMLAGQFGSFIADFLKLWQGSIEPGDVFITNDPYSVAGAISHLNDWLIMKPIFFGKKLIGWAANFGHMTDTGGCVPGSLPNGVSSIFEDGVQIPVTKLVSAGKRNDSLMETIFRNCRLPEWNRCDVSALMAACNVAQNRLLEMYTRLGDRIYFRAISELLNRNRRAMSTLFDTAIPDHPVYFEDWIDDDGKGAGPWKIACTVSKEGGRLKTDFTGTYPQSTSSINFLLSHSMFKMFIGFYLIAVYDPGNLVNDGFHDLIDMHVPEGSLLNPIRPAALSCRTHLLGRVMDLLAGLLGQKAPEFMTAGGFSDSPHLMFSGYKASGEWFQLYQIGFGGVPARPHGDGMDGHSLWPAFKSIPNELLELQYPLRIEEYKLVTDSGGPGLYRGGNGQRICYRFLDKGEISTHDDRWLSYPCGVVGGMPGARSSKVLVHNHDGSGRREVLGSKADHIVVNEGDLLEWVTWGGGGYGDPLRRAPSLVALEVRRGLVSFEGAKRYGVVVKSDFTVDEYGTDQLREDIRNQRPAGWEKEVFDRGGPMKEIAAKALQETGLQAPTHPSKTLARGPHSGLKWVQDWFEEHGSKDIT